jgi:hypothetical protein
LKQAGKSIQWWQEKRRGEEYSRVNSFSEIEARRDPVQLKKKKKKVEPSAKYLGVVPLSSPSQPGEATRLSLHLNNNPLPFLLSTTQRHHLYLVLCTSSTLPLASQIKILVLSQWAAT